MTTTTLFTGARRNYAATRQVHYKNSYKMRLMDRCILDDICNGNPENIKSYLGVGKGSEVELYIPGNVKVRETAPDGGIIYQTMTDTFERFGVNHECYWAIKRRPEDKAFMPFDPMSDHFTSATDQMARHMEKMFGAIMPSLVPSFNKGHNAGVTYGAFDLGDCTAGDAVVLYKTQRQVDRAIDVPHRAVAADFILGLAEVIRENEGLSGGHVNVVVPSPIRHLIATSELKYEGLMGRNARLGSGKRGGRNEVKFLGTMDDTVGLIMNNIMFRDSVMTYEADGKKHTIYPIYAQMADANAFVHDTLLREDALKDVGVWDEHYRAKEVYDFPVVFPQMMAIAYVEIAEPAYTPDTGNGGSEDNA